MSNDNELFSRTLENKWKIFAYNNQEFKIISNVVL